MPKDRIAGLDIGTSKVRLIVAEFESNRLVEVLSMTEQDSAGVRNGVIIDIDEAARSILSVVSAAGQGADPPIKRVVVGVSGQHIASLNSRSVVAITRSSRRIADDDIDRALEQARIIVLPPDREILHCIPRSYRIDGQGGVTRPVGMYGNRLEMDSHIVTGHYSHTQNLAAAVRCAGLEIAGAVLSSIASSQAVLKAEERDLGVMTVDIGDGATDISIYDDGAISHSAVLPIGGGEVTRDLRAAYNISEAEAERAMDRDSGTPSDIVHSRIEQILHLVRLEVIKSGFYNILPAGVVLTGGTANLDIALSLAESILKMPVRVGVPSNSPHIPRSMARPEYATVFGLVLHAAANPPRVSAGQSIGLTKGFRHILGLFGRFGAGATV